MMQRLGSVGNDSNRCFPHSLNKLLSYLQESREEAGEIRTAEKNRVVGQQTKFHIPVMLKVTTVLFARGLHPAGKS